MASSTASAYPGWGPAGEVTWVRSEDGCDLLRRKWAPSLADGSRPAGVVHICHGMAEHSERYGHLAAALTRAGYVVYSADHRAHGHTAVRAKENGSRAHWHGHHDGGSQGAVQQIIRDHEMLCAQEIQEHEGLPFIVFGHSMGSVIATNVACTPTVARKIAGLALSGCPARLPALHSKAFGPLLLALKAIHGGSGVAPLISKLSFEKFNAKYAPNKSDDDWLNRDAEEVKKYTDDPMCGFKCSVDFMRSFLAAVKSAGDPEALRKLPRGLPILVMNGGDDQVTFNDFGARSHQQVSDEFVAAGVRAPKIIIYGEARHEIANELCRDDFTRDLLTFLSTCTREAPMSRL